MKKIIPIIIGLIIFTSSSQAVFIKTMEFTENYDFLIITPENFSTELDSLRIHKESHGIKTQVVTLNEIYDSFYFEVQGRDDAEKIKYFIKSAIENWDIGYVILVGGKGTMPVRFVEIIY